MGKGTRGKSRPSSPEGWWGNLCKVPVSISNLQSPQKNCMAGPIGRRREQQRGKSNPAQWCSNTPLCQNHQGPLNLDTWAAVPPGTLAHLLWNQDPGVCPSTSTHEDSDTQPDGQPPMGPAPPESLFSYLSSKSNIGTSEPKPTDRRYKMIDHLTKVTWLGTWTRSHLFQVQVWNLSYFDDERLMLLFKIIFAGEGFGLRAN